MAYIIKKVKDSTPIDIPCGVLRKLTGSDECKEVDFAHITITDKTKKHYHKKLTEVYYILKGAIDIEVDGEKHRLNKNEMIMIYPDTHHTAWKTTEEDAELLVMCTPPWNIDDELFVE